MTKMILITQWTKIITITIILHYLLKCIRHLESGIVEIESLIDSLF
jgi:hypothetical protein